MGEAYVQLLILRKFIKHLFYLRKQKINYHIKIYFSELSILLNCLRHYNIYSFKINNHERVLIIAEGGKADGK
jgi:hypothetical protein